MGIRWKHGPGKFFFFLFSFLPLVKSNEDLELSSVTKIEELK